MVHLNRLALYHSSQRSSSAHVNAISQSVVVLFHLCRTKRLSFTINGNTILYLCFIMLLIVDLLFISFTIEISFKFNLS